MPDAPDQPYRLSQAASAGGCAAKIGPGDLRTMLASLGAGGPAAGLGGAIVFAEPGTRVLVGPETLDDAGVLLFRGQALIATTDFIPPVCDDPFRFGRIAATNAISDVYAMGGRPISALNLCVFPPALAATSARAILSGASAKLREAGAVLLGGHTVRGPELLFGLAVTGVVAPTAIWRNVGARPGDVLLLTKPLGCGLIVTGSRKGLVADAERQACRAGMVSLNRRAAEVLAQFAVHAATDVTGFGLAGHALGMTRLEDVSLHLKVGELPVYPGALALAAQGVTCGGAKSNRRAYKDRLALQGSLSPAYEELIFDPQTSGGLLCALAAADAEPALAALRAAGVQACRIGEVGARAAAALVVYGDAGAGR